MLPIHRPGPIVEARPRAEIDLGAPPGAELLDQILSHRRQQPLDEYFQHDLLLVGRHELRGIQVDPVILVDASLDSIELPPEGVPVARRPVRLVRGDQIIEEADVGTEAPVE
jgi:hypothetical protein